MTPVDVLLVGVGGGLGSLLRWAVGKAVGEHWHKDRFPLGTFLVNVSGAFVIGFLATLFGLDFTVRYGDVLTSGVLTGFLGGYTTFSSMQLDAATLATKSGARYAALYLLASVVVGGIAAALGILLGNLVGAA
ncbi:fluoride efflux transporter FluC [Thiocapsa rosea]|uniref:Fluoride-specific ion channel FluC n=1 Tax=Thiocapsa rosea TaxID=69360 RepID=A0A495VFI8_9GAMM|nr:CrcB family protein [Thiocapsa rosea]RKT47353.1 camphor resistance protein CrcB [Thiocapsa rosea]